MNIKKIIPTIIPGITPPNILARKSFFNVNRNNNDNTTFPNDIKNDNTSCFFVSCV